VAGIRLRAARVLAIIAGRLHGRSGDDAPERAASVVLRPWPSRERGRRVANRPLPKSRSAKNF